MITASCEETTRPMSGGLEFDVKLAQHTAVACCQVVTLKRSLVATARVRFARRERAKW